MDGAVRQKTLLFLVRPAERQVLLAMKKRGFGAGKWNGVGGKVEPGESVEAAAVREAHEEIGVTVRLGDLAARGVVSFSFDGSPDIAQDVRVFLAERWEGGPAESEEMRPVWYAYDALPYGEMWVSDRLWLPQVLSGESIIGRVHFSSSGEEILEQEVRAGDASTLG